MRVAQIKEAEQRLADLGYWTGPVDGRMDAGSRFALVAFQKVEGRARTGRLTADELQALRQAKSPVPVARNETHIEIDLARQVLFVVDATGAVAKILPVSTGSGKMFTSGGWSRLASTLCGKFHVQRKLAGWHKSPLGRLYYPSFIYGGVAIHGNPAVPAYPASHGCIRIPMFAAKEFSELTPSGTIVIIYDSNAPEKASASMP